MWKRANVVLKLKSPLHIGYLPSKGSVISPTRYYVPGRNFWGAVTKRITESIWGNLRSEEIGGKYKEIGLQVAKTFRFSYFYLFDGDTLYLPRFTENGLRYGAGEKGITRFEFERRFIGSVVSTAIDHDTQAAMEGKLHEIEFINNKYLDSGGKVRDSKIAGCIWIKEDEKFGDKEIMLDREGIFISDVNVVEELIIGGESKYGFGHVILDSINKQELKDFLPALWQDPDNIKLNKSSYTHSISQNENVYLPSHMKYGGKVRFKGEIELISGIGYYYPTSHLTESVVSNAASSACSNKSSNTLANPECCIAPGSKLELENDLRLVSCWDGVLRENSNRTGE
ncbi:MAG: hypothetical protein H5T41_00750 [Methanomassiliicoccales archaeon]|nr:hypothetical protein [Methanomassiliicoccales archaeon]